MPLTRIGALAVLAALPLAASTIVTYEPTVVLSGGDALAFRFSPWSYRAHTGSVPERMFFQLSSLALDPQAEFSAVLQSPDGALSAEIEGLQIGSGYFQSAAYHGPVSTLSGSFEIPPALAGVFSGPAAVLVFRNLGRDVTLGVPPIGIASTLGISLSGPDLSVGAVVVSAQLDTAAQPSMLADAIAGFPAADSAPGAVPEPSSALLLASSGALLLLVSRALKRMRRGRIQQL